MGERIADILGDTSLSRAHVEAVAGSYRALSIMASRLSYAFVFIRRPKASASPGPSVPTPSDSDSNFKPALLGCTSSRIVRVVGTEGLHAVPNPTARCSEVSYYWARIENTTSIKAVLIS